MEAGNAKDLAGFIEEHPRLFVLTGAGLSTLSGIPDYRDAQGKWKRRQPVLAQDFLRSESVRRRYWARSLVGWPVIAGARPNSGHAALARLEAASRVRQLVTQNVDGLHQRAGSSRVIELHGSIAGVRCLTCQHELPRERMQAMLLDANPQWAGTRADTAPDGDADIEPENLEAFIVPPCPVCGGIIKPTVVFFGDSVPRERVTVTLEALEDADAMLVVGSSLMVYSGYRFCEHAQRHGKPIAAINMGQTRADHLFSLKVERPCAEALAELVAGLGLATGGEAD
jgi:NAD-dependent SIR2 family protein deacetylase